MTTHWVPGFPNTSAERAYIPHTMMPGRSSVPAPCPFATVALALLDSGSRSAGPPASSLVNFG